MSRLLSPPYGIMAGLFLGVAIALLLPLFARGLPPGADSPTFLHFNWLYYKAWVQGPSIPLWDPYWYGGFNPFFTYSPLGPLATAVPAAIVSVDPVVVHKLWLLIAVAATGLAVYLLALELGIKKGYALIAALLSEASYPLLSSIGLWGRFTTVLALPLALFSLLFLERGLLTGKARWAVISGATAAVTLLVHHMTGFVLFTLLPFILLPSLVKNPRRVKALGIFLIVVLIGAGWWVVPFLQETISIGFSREVPGLWTFSITSYLRALLDRGLINQYGYPSYFGLPLALLAFWGLPLAVVERRFLGYVLGLGWLFVLSLGGNTPFGRLPGLASLDAARFPLYMVPFAAILAAYGIEHTLSTAFRRYGLRLLAAIALLVASLLALGLVDAFAARRSLHPYQPSPESRAAMTWLCEEGAPGRVFAVGFWHWDAYLLPALADRESVTGWYIEGARNWRELRPLDLMMFTGNIDIERLWRTLVKFQARYVVISHYNTAENPEAFERLIQPSPIFRMVKEWEGLKIYEVLPEG